MPNRSIYGRWMAGHFTIPLAILVGGVLTWVPWETIYSIGSYREFSRVMSTVSRNLIQIPNSSNPFPEYSIAFLSFINAVGPLYAVLGFYFGLKHIAKVKNELSDARFSTPKLIWSVPFFLVAILVLLWGTYMFSGESTMFPGRFYVSEWRFVSFFTLLWILISMFGFGLSAILLILFKRIKNK